MVQYEDRNQLIQLIDRKRKYFRKSEKIVLNALETIHHNLNWIERNVKVVNSHLKLRFTYLN